MPTGPTNDTRDAILDAAIESVSLYGLARLSMSDVAGRAGISRPTLYKHFGSKEELVAGVVARETNVLMAEVVGVAEAEDDPLASFEAAMVAALRLTREHPLLDRIIRTEPEALLPFLATDGAPGAAGSGGAAGAGGGAALGFVREATRRIVAARVPDLDEVTARRLTDMIARLFISYAISAPDDPPEVVAASVARIIVFGIAETAEGAI
jgi:AcrR family transcriptional regulator